MTKKTIAKKETINPVAFLGDWTAPEGHEAEIPLPYIQWLNGLGPAWKQVSPLLESGGWEFPLDLWAGAFGDTHQVLQVPHGVGQSTVDEGYVLPLIHIAILNSRFVWEKQEGGGKAHYSAQYQDGFRSRLNVFCVVKETGAPDPLLLTLRGLTTKHFNVAKRLHLGHIVKTANKFGSAAGYPQYLFWCPLRVGPSVKAGENIEGKITPPVPAWNQEAFKTDNLGEIAEELRELYIGEELRDLVANELYQEGQQWGEDWDRFMANNAAQVALPKNGKTFVHEVDEASGRLVIPEQMDDIKAWLRWGESAMGQDHGEGGKLFAQLLRDPIIPTHGEKQKWEAWVGLVSDAYNQNNDILSEEEATEHLIR